LSSRRSRDPVAGNTMPRISWDRRRNISGDGHR
jgi:hypothetical protein